MEQITFEETAQKMVIDLEGLLAKMAVASDAGLSTYWLEPEAQKLSAKLKASAEILNGLTLYKDVNGSQVYGSSMAKLPDSIYMAYASISKKCKDNDMNVFKEDGKYFVKFSDNLYINLDDIPHEEMPKFKVKIEGNTLMAVRADLYNKLPENAKKLLNNKTEED